MSAIPSSAMPHAFAHDDDDQDARETSASGAPSKGVLIGGAVAAYLLYRILR
jgi:hypothetical protein